MSTALPDLKPVLARLAAGERLTQAEAQGAFDLLMEGRATPAQIGAFLMALRLRGETVEEITGGALALRARMSRIAAPKDAVDTCGTGGDGQGSFNISTAAALVAAAAGATVAKHGNRAQSSKSGSADLLAALGLNLDAPKAALERALKEARIAFLMAPRHHGAMRHVAEARRELGFRTVFNLLGPLANPAGAKRQLIGVFAEEWLTPIAEVLKALGSERVWVVHGWDGLDELTTTGPSEVAALEDGRIRRFAVTPEEAGLSRAKPAALAGGTAEENAARLRALLEGEKGPLRDIVLLNAAAALIVAGKAENLAGGAALAAAALDDGHAKATLEALLCIANEAGEP